MQDLINRIPTGYLCLDFIVLCIVVTISGLLIFRAIAKKEWLKVNHHVSGVFFSAVSLIYSLVLAFVIVAAWQDYNELNRSIEQETDKLSNIVSHSQELPIVINYTIVSDVQQYARWVVKQEWKTFGKQEQMPYNNSLQELRHLLYKMLPSNDAEAKILATVDDDLSTVDDYRRERISHNHSRMPPLVWMVLLAGSAITIFFSWFFYVDSYWLQYLFTALLTCMIAMCLFLVFMLDHPFDGTSKVSNEPFVGIYTQITGQ